MVSQVTTYQKIHLPKGAEIQWGGPQLLPEGPWMVTLAIQKFPNGGASTTFFGTEEQVKAIAKGCDGFLEENITPDPAQLDALDEVAEPELLSERTDMVDLATRAVGLGVVKSW